MNAFTRISLGVVGTGFLLAGTASANSLMGPFPYDFPARSAETALILYESKKAGSLGEGSETNIGAYTLNTGSSTSIGNWQQIEQTLSDGSTGTIDSTADQSADGSSQTSSTDFTITHNNADDEQEEAP
ncbi:hypothetical protein [Cobetia sp. 5-11-6-3]|uniref:hypothetical protein n=1 Tax=Cobetia sp. 5-11-6-3 TaxID=2737458 RepID=UPI0015969936|nr:hypothetical protein [Cobetia sp. 5-11-6-3]